MEKTVLFTYNLMRQNAAVGEIDGNRSISKLIGNGKTFFQFCESDRRDRKNHSCLAG